jgi:hypothetical protein
MEYFLQSSWDILLPVEVMLYNQYGFSYRCTAKSNWRETHHCFFDNSQLTEVSDDSSMQKIREGSGNKDMN